MTTSLKVLFLLFVIFVILTLVLLFHSRCFALDGEFYAVGLDLDESTFEQIAYGLLEHFLADTKHGVDFFGWRLVMIGRESLFGEFEVLEKTGGEITNEDTTVGWGVDS